MAANIFYSWQSDLPNKTNRSFIESCINKAIEQLKQVELFSIEICLDRDTKDEPGTPDIVNTIFKKIEEAKVFVADISIINSDSESQKTPNPNVLIELGYAAKVLGWERIICIYNKDYGNYNDLPFDLKFRRPLGYSLKGGDKETTKKNVAKAIIESITNLHIKGLLFDEVDDYFKVQIDTQILTIINHFTKMLYGYNTFHGFEGIKRFLDLNVTQLSDIIKRKHFLGFQIFKKYEYIENELKILLDKVNMSPSYKKEKVVPIIDLIKWIGSFDNFNECRTCPDLYYRYEAVEEGYIINDTLNTYPDNSKYPERCLLLKKVDKEKAMVQDFGDFPKYVRDKLLWTFRINEKHIMRYSHYVIDFITIIHKWLDVTGGEFIVDNIKTFRMRKVSNQEEYR